jgi:hypothetical protein
MANRGIDANEAFLRSLGQPMTHGALGSNET